VVRILAAVKRVWEPRVTTVLPRQGPFAADEELERHPPAPDVVVEGVGDLMRLERALLVGGS
jgi:hypothetical protein